MFDGWQSYKHMQSTEACVAHVKLSLYANTKGVNRVKLVKCAETSQSLKDWSHFDESKSPVESWVCYVRTQVIRPISVYYKKKNTIQFTKTNGATVREVNWRSRFL